MKVSQSNSRACWVLKCDVRKFFASIDHERLIEIFKRHINDIQTIWLVECIVGSFQSTGPGKGLPLGNLTSQLLINVYMNEFDQFIKHKLKAKYYIRYADDFVIMHHEKGVLVDILPKVKSFLSEQLKLLLHPDKVFIKTAVSGVDFLGWVHFPHHRVIRTTTKNRMFKKIKDSQEKPEVVQSYLGLLSHGNGWKLQQKIINLINY
jgi:retron-type reverse transcriptase